MNKFNIALAVAGTFIVVAGIATADYRKTVREEEAKRAEIKRNIDLDVKAVDLAAERIHKKLREGGSFSTLSDVAHSLNDEIKFQKIAVRLED